MAGTGTYSQTRAQLCDRFLERQAQDREPVEELPPHLSTTMVEMAVTAEMMKMVETGMKEWAMVSLMMHMQRNLEH